MYSELTTYRGKFVHLASCLHLCCTYIGTIQLYWYKLDCILHCSQNTRWRLKNTVFICNLMMVFYDFQGMKTFWKKLGGRRYSFSRKKGANIKYFIFQKNHFEGQKLSMFGQVTLVYFFFQKKIRGKKTFFQLKLILFFRKIRGRW